MATTKAKSKKPKKKTAVLNVDGVDVPVTFNTTGRLDKKSQDAFNAILNRTLAQNTVSRFTARDAVEIAGFGGLVGMIYYGSDILLRILSLLNLGEALVEIPEAIGKTIIKTVDDVNEVLGDLQKVLTPPWEAMMLGMFKDDIKKAKEAAVVRTEGEIAAAKIIWERTKEEFRRRIAETTDSEVVAKANEAIEAGDKQIEKLEAEKQARVARELERLIFKIKVAGSFGGAYVIKKFLESYEFSEAAENVQFTG